MYNKGINIKVWDRDCNLFLLIIVISILFVYYSPPLISKIAFIIYLFFVFLTKKDFLWIAFLFITYDPPNYLFFGGLVNDPQRIPIYPINPGISLTFQDLLILILFLKSFIRGNEYPVAFSKQLLLLLFLFLVLLLFGFLLGLSPDNFILTIRYFMPLLLFIVIPRLLNNKEQWYGLIKVLLPVVIFTFAGQLYYIFTARPLASLISTDILSKVNANFAGYQVDISLSRFYTGAFINFFCFITSAYLLGQKTINVNRIYLLIIMVSAYLQPLLSATRGYFIMYSIILIFWLGFQLNLNRVTNTFLTGAFLIVFFFVGIKSDYLGNQIYLALKRLETIEALAKGDLTASGTLQRITERSPVVMGKFRESPAIGFGFSDQYYLYDDDHIGNQNILLNGGILGFVAFNLLLFLMVARLTRIAKKEDLSQGRYTNRYLNRIFLVGFLGLFFLHSGGRQIFGYALPPYVQMLVVLFFCFWNFIVITNIRYSVLIKSNFKGAQLHG